MSDLPAPDDANASATFDAWSTNGVHDLPEAPPEPEATATAETPEPSATDEAAGDEAAPQDAPDDVVTADADNPAEFLNELVHAMRTTAAAERSRIASDVDRRREEHLAAIHSRRETEAQRIRDLADDDLKGIDAWAEDERQRIDSERARRAEALAADLETSLSQHGTRVDGEVERVEAAISAYRAKVDAFFAELEGAADPVAIAQLAGQRPVFPDLAAAASPDGGSDEESAPAEAVATDAGAEEATDTDADADAEVAEPVAVMDPDAGAKLAAAFAAWNAGGPAALATDSGRDASSDDRFETVAASPVAVARGGHDNGPGTVLHAVPSSRPLSWLRRDRDSSGGYAGDD